MRQYKEIIFNIIYIPYVYIKAPPRVYENTAWGGMLRDKYSTRGSQVLYLSWDTPQVLYFYTDKLGGALIDILYFQKVKVLLALACLKHSRTLISMRPSSIT